MNVLSFFPWRIRFPSVVVVVVVAASIIIIIMVNHCRMGTGGGYL